MSAPFQYDIVEMTATELEDERRVFGGLTQSIRELNEACLMTTVDAAEAEAITTEIAALTARLNATRDDGASFGVAITQDGQVRGHGNAVVGLRNAHAVPLEIHRTGEGRAWSHFELNGLFEGPPTLVHGGVTALILDQIFGEAAADGGHPGMTGTLTLTYRRGTPLGKLSAEAWIDKVEGIKTHVLGEMRDAEGNVTVEGHGVFILPRWAREEQARQAGAQPPRYE